MPKAAARPCTKAGCRALVLGGGSRCPDHPYDPRPVVSGSRDPFYTSAKWRAIRRNFLAKHKACACGAPATVVDHVLARSIRPDLQWDTANMAPMCHPCHARKSATTDGWLGNPRGRR